MNTCYNSFSLNGKSILITGASSGIGKATALECAKAGANVIITGRSKDRLNSTAGEIKEVSSREPILFTGDLSDESFRIYFCDSLKGVQIDGLALCAGTVSVNPVAFSTNDKVMSVFQTNFFANVDLIRRLLKAKNLRRGSSIAVIASVLGLDGYMPGNACYGASKAALESWIKYCALEYSAKGIRFNTIHPGSINTPMLNISSVSEDQMNDAISKIPMKHIGQPEEIARPIVFLLSEASSFMTGTSIIIDGGQHLLF